MDENRINHRFLIIFLFYSKGELKIILPDPVLT